MLHMLEALFRYNQEKQREIIICKETDENDLQHALERFTTDYDK